jgi:hypothetical protein
VPIYLGVLYDPFMRTLPHIFHVVTMTTSKYTRNDVRSRESLSINTLSQKHNETQCQPKPLSFTHVSDMSFYSERQGTLDDVVTKSPCPPTFTKAGLLDFIIELVVLGDNVRVSIFVVDMTSNQISLQAIQFIDNVSFRRLVFYIRPTLQESDIPHRTKLRKEILDRAKVVEERIRVKLQVSGNHLKFCSLFSQNSRAR